MIITYGDYTICNYCCHYPPCSEPTVIYSQMNDDTYGGLCAEHSRKLSGSDNKFNSLDDVKAHIAMREL